MSDTVAADRPALGADVEVAPPTGRRPPWVGRAVRLALLVVALALPLYLDSFWLQVGVFAFAAMVAALGLNLLVGLAGQLSLAHSFFIAIGAYGYTFFASETVRLGVSDQKGLGLPPAVAMVLAVALAGVAGLLFTPVAARLRGIYLGVASLGLVFLAQHILFNAEPVTGGFNGRNVPPFHLFGFVFDDTAGETLYVLGVPFHRLEKLWYLSLTGALLAYVYYRNLRRSRPGLALEAVRDGEVAASVMGVDVTRYKGSAFMVSSMYAGFGGVLLALAFRRIVPETFGLALAIEYLAMIVIGGLGSGVGAMAGAVFVSSLPTVLQKYSASLPFLAASGSGGITPGVAARFVYGAAIVLVLIFEPGGLAGLGRRVSRLVSRQATSGRSNP